MDLSIVIASYETPALLAACLASIDSAARVAPSLSLEVIVVDNGSRDESLSRVEASELNVQLVARRVNRGFASAMNAGIRRSSGRYVLLLNSDVEITGTLLEAAVARLDLAPSIGILGPALVHVDGRPSARFMRCPAGLLSSSGTASLGECTASSGITRARVKGARGERWRRCEARFSSSARIYLRKSACSMKDIFSFSRRPIFALVRALRAIASLTAPN